MQLLQIAGDAQDSQGWGILEKSRVENALTNRPEIVSDFPIVLISQFDDTHRPSRQFLKFFSISMYKYNITLKSTTNPAGAIKSIIG
jgi:hypothetical protein